MGARGRKSSAELSVVPSQFARPLPRPPKVLSEESAEVWRSVVRAMPADWFRAEHYALLEQFCGHVVRARRLSAELAKCPDEGLTSADGAAHYDRIARAAERESRAMVAIARSLRMTHQSQIRAETAGRRVARHSEGPLPWEFE